VLRAWFKAGLTAQECVELLRAQGTDVEANTVHRAWSRLGLRRRVYYDQDLPWVVDPVHIKNTNLNRLRNVGRMRHYMCKLHPEYKPLFERWISGEPLTPDEVDEFDAVSLRVFDPQDWMKEYVRFSNWWRRMRKNGKVVHYTRGRRDAGARAPQYRSGLHSRTGRRGRNP
jgi:hypothetical protein